MPVSGLFKGISHPQDHIFIPRFAVDHQANRQPLTGKATRYRQTTQVQDIANDRVAEILQVSCAVRIHGGINLSDWQRGNHCRGDEQSIHLAQSLKHLGAQWYPGACRVEILGRADVLALDHTLAHNGVVLLKVCLKARLMDGIRLCGNR